MQEFLAEWARGDDQQAAELTDDPATAKMQLAEVREDLRVTAARSEAVPSHEDADDADAAERTIPYHAVLGLASLGDWTYDGQLSVRRTRARARQRIGGSSGAPP